MANLMKLTPPPADAVPPGVTDQRGLDAFKLRYGDAIAQAAATTSLKHTPNGDEANYLDRSGSYTKGLKQASPGVVDSGTFTAFRKALGTSDGVTPGTADFENAALLLGDERKLNGPQGAFAGTLVGADSETFGDSVVPMPPAVASKEYATELVELYWASLLRDVPFTAYDTNPFAKAAAAELTSLPTYAGPRDAAGNVTTALLFRGGLKIGTPKKTYFDGETVGPYISQFCIQPTNLGAQPIDQKMNVYAANVDYMTNFDTWAAVQNGVQSLITPEIDVQRRYMYNGRALATFTRVDELYQAYFVAYLAMNTFGVRTNPGNPYLAFKKQQAFGTFGGPDIAATLGAVARVALNAVWYQKWVVHLRHRESEVPEAVERGTTAHFARASEENHPREYPNRLPLRLRARRRCRCSGLQSPGCRCPAINGPIAPFAPSSTRNGSGSGRYTHPQMNGPAIPPDGTIGTWGSAQTIDPLPDLLQARRWVR